MSTTRKAERRAAGAGERARRGRARAQQRRWDTALVPVTAARLLGISVAELAGAMRGSGVQERLTEAQATRWNAAPETAPQWFTTLLGERMARAAEQEYRRARDEEQRQLRALAAEQSALAKVRAGKRRFNDGEWAYVQDWAFRAAKDLVRGGRGLEIDDFDRLVLRAAGVNAADHSTWPLHAGGCDGEGREHCSARIEAMRAARRADALIDSVAKESAVRDSGLAPGQAVTAWHGSRVGTVVKVNKVTVKVRMIGGQRDRHAPVEKNLDPRHLSPAPDSLPAAPQPGDIVLLRDRGGHTRTARVIESNGPLFEATYSVNSGQWRSGWFDLFAIQPGHGKP